MIKNISKNSPKIGLLLLVITVVFDLPNIFGQSNSDAAGNAMQSAFQLFFALCLYTPLLILYLISIIRLVKNPKVFDKSISWTVIHLLPILFFVFAGLSLLERETTSYKNKNEYTKLAKYERYFEDTSDSTNYLILKQNFVFYVSDRRDFAPDWGPYIETIGKINNNAFESIYTKQKLSSSHYWDLQKMKNKKGDSFFQIHGYNQITYGKDTYMFPEEFYPTLFKLK